MEALIVIDMFVRDVENRPDKKRLLKNQVRLMLAFTDAGKPVFLVGHSRTKRKEPNPVMLELWGDEESPDPEKNKVMPELLSAPHNHYVGKREYSGFYRTQLGHHCKTYDVTDLYLTGISSGCCVHFTAADAAMRGIKPHLVIDASGAPDEATHADNAKKFTQLLGPTTTTRSLVHTVSR